MGDTEGELTGTTIVSMKFQYSLNFAVWGTVTVTQNEQLLFMQCHRIPQNSSLGSELLYQVVQGLQSSVVCSIAGKKFHLIDSYVDIYGRLPLDGKISLESLPDVEGGPSPVLCLSCLDRGVTSEAVTFCTDCKKLFCSRHHEVRYSLTLSTVQYGDT